MSYSRSKEKQEEEYLSEEDEDFVPDVESGDDADQDMFLNEGSSSKSKKKGSKSKEVLRRPQRRGPFDSEDELSNSGDEEPEEGNGHEPPSKKFKTAEEENYSTISTGISTDVEQFYSQMMKGKSKSATTTSNPTPGAESIQTQAYDINIGPSNNITETQHIQESQKGKTIEEKTEGSNLNTNDPMAFFAMMKKGSSSKSPLPNATKTDNLSSLTSIATVKETSPTEKLAVPASWLAPTSTSLSSTESQSSSSTPLLTGPQKVVIKETFDYAGEQVTVERKVDAMEAEALAAKKSGSGLGGILDQLKEAEGIEDELNQNKKDGYLNKQAFLHQADLAEFEHEREVRNKARAKRG